MSNIREVAQTRYCPVASACAAWSAEQVDGAGMAGRGGYPSDITIYCAICERILVIYIVTFSFLGVMSCQRERAGCPRDISPVDREQRTASREAEGMGLAGRHLARYRGKPFFLAPPMTGFSCQGVGRLLEAKTDPGVDSSSCKLVRD